MQVLHGVQILEVFVPLSLEAIVSCIRVIGLRIYHSMAELLIDFSCGRSLSLLETRWEFADRDPFDATEFLAMREPLGLVDLLIFGSLLDALEVEVELQSIVPRRHRLGQLLLEQLRFQFRIGRHHLILRGALSVLGVTIRGLTAGLALRNFGFILLFALILLVLFFLHLLSIHFHLLVETLLSLNEIDFGVEFYSLSGVMTLI